MSIFNRNIIWPVFGQNDNEDDKGTYTFHVKKDRNVEPESSFSLSSNDKKALNEWLSEHNKTCTYYDDGSSPSNPCGAIGGRLSYSFTPTGLGTIFVVTCACDDKLNLTNVDNW